jgi:excisionase family DNA binding protein
MYKKLYSLETVCEALSISMDELLNAIRENKIKVVPMGNDYRISYIEFDRVVQEGI